MSQMLEEPITLLIDPAVLAIPIKEIHEPMIDLIDQAEIMYGPSPEIPNNQDYTKIRRTVYEKLVVAQKRLPKPFRFCLYEGYRSLSLQKKLFEDRYNLLKNHYPNLNHEELFHETTKLVAPVINLDGSHNIPPHSTGAAIDIYLVDDYGKIIDMGINVADWMDDLDGSLSKTLSLKISKEAKRHRSIMSHVLEEVGFVNYPGEYWHWSYGDRYWAFLTGKEYALYNNFNEIEISR